MVEQEPPQEPSQPTVGKSAWLPLPFDRNGSCIAPQTREDILEAAGADGITDVVVFCHGWNNDRQVASERYAAFIEQFRAMQAEHDLLPVAGVLLVGILWPSTSLVMGDERVLAMAGGGAGEPEIAELVDLVEASDRERFCELASRSALTPAEAAELAECLPETLGTSDDEAPEDHDGDGRPTAVWQRLPAPGTDRERSPEEIAAALADFGRVVPSGSARPGSGDAPVAAGRGLIDPRKLIRVLSVRQMKDRAGTVGAAGVARFIEDLLRDSAAHVHLVGHSYGARVMLAATCATRDVRKVRSMLLLQPAVSHLCFAAPIPGTERRAGFADAPDKVELPILATFSPHDRPLRTFFHLALWRRGDLGDLDMAARARTPKYGALGGYGPSGLEQRAVVRPMALPPASYDLTGDEVAVVALDGAQTIHGHGDVINVATTWALYDLMTRVVTPRG
jgi:hypothetical protein